MNLELLLPKVYHFVKSKYMIDGKSLNNFINSANSNNDKKLLYFCIVIFVISLISICCAFCYVHFTGNSSSPTSSFIAVFACIAMTFSFVLGTFQYDYIHNPLKYADIVAFGNGFQVRQTSFIIQPNEKSFQSNGKKYLASSNVNFDRLTNNKDHKQNSSKNYAIYAKVYNDKLTSYKTYLIGNMSNGQFMLISQKQAETYSKMTKHDRFTPKYNNDIANKKLMNNKQLNTLATYTEYIKKYHLENNFKNDAKLIISKKYYDSNYEPQLVMKGKDGKVLYLKHNISKKDIDNVEMVNYTTN